MLKEGSSFYSRCGEWGMKVISAKSGSPRKRARLTTSNTECNWQQGRKELKQQRDVIARRILAWLKANHCYPIVETLLSFVAPEYVIGYTYSTKTGKLVHSPVFHVLAALMRDLDPEFPGPLKSFEHTIYHCTSDWLYMVPTGWQHQQSNGFLRW